MKELKKISELYRPIQPAVSEFDTDIRYLEIEPHKKVEHVDDVYKQLKEKGVWIEIELRDEPWGDRHFAIVDPNGIGIDFVTYTSPDE